MEDSSSDRRIQHRIESALPIQVRWLDGEGIEHEQSATALEVSRRGLSFMSVFDLPLFTKLTVLIPGHGPVRGGEGPTDFFSEAAVVRTVKEGETYRVSVRFVGATLVMYSPENI